MAQQDLRSKHAAQKQAAQNQSASQPAINPVIDEKLTQYIAANPKLHEHYMAQPKEYLVRKLMLDRMNRGERQMAKQAAMLKWAESTPEVKAKIDKAIANKPEDQKTRIAVAIARRESQYRGMQQSSAPAAPKQSV